MKRSFWGEFGGAAELFFGDVKTSDGELVWVAYGRAATFKQNVAAWAGRSLIDGFVVGRRSECNKKDLWLVDLIYDYL